MSTILVLADKGCKIIMMDTLNNKRKRQATEVGKWRILNIELKYILKYKTGILELKNTKFVIKDSLNGFSNRLDTSENKVHDLPESSAENIQTVVEKRERNGKKTRTIESQRTVKRTNLPIIQLPEERTDWTRQSNIWRDQGQEFANRWQQSRNSRSSANHKQNKHEENLNKP